MQIKRINMNIRSDRDLLMDIERKLDDVKESVHDLEKNQLEIKKDLSYHIKRTDLLQNEVTHLSERFKPIESIRFTWNNLFKLVALFAGLATIVTAFFAVLKNVGFFNE